MTIRKSSKRAWIVVAASLVVVLTTAIATPVEALRRGDGDEGQDRVAIFSTIEITEDQPAADVACAFCTVHVHGDVHGDVAVIFSTVDVGSDRTISGDVATLFSTLRVGEDAHIAGDLATALGHTEIAPSATVSGDRAVWASGLGLAVVLAPLLIVAGLFWLLIWVVRRAFF